MTGSPITFLSCHLRLRVHQFVIQGAQPFREHARAGEDRHEISVAAPARHDVDMQMIRHTRACAFTKIQTDVKSPRLRRGTLKRLRMRDQIPKLLRYGTAIR